MIRYAGKVSEFNRISGRGAISSKAYGGRIDFRASQVIGGNGKLDAGDHVEFEVGTVGDVHQAVSVRVVSRLAASQQRAVRVPTGESGAQPVAPTAGGAKPGVGPVVSKLPSWP